MGSWRTEDPTDVIHIGQSAVDRGDTEIAVHSLTGFISPNFSLLPKPESLKSPNFQPSANIPGILKLHCTLLMLFPLPGRLCLPSCI